MRIGAGRPTGSAVPPGRRVGLGATRTGAHATGIQPVLPVHGQFDGSGGLEPGGFSEDLSHAPKLPPSRRGVSNVADQRDAELAGRSLPADAARPAYGFDRGSDAPARRETFFGANAGPLGAGSGVEWAIAAGALEAVARIARSGDLARFAEFGIQRDSGRAAGAGRHGKIENQPRADRAGQGAGADGSAAGIK